MITMDLDGFWMLEKKFHRVVRMFGKNVQEVIDMK